MLLISKLQPQESSQLRANIKGPRTQMCWFQAPFVFLCHCTWCLQPSCLRDSEVWASTSQRPTQRFVRVRSWLKMTGCHYEYPESSLATKLQVYYADYGGNPQVQKSAPLRKPLPHRPDNAYSPQMYSESILVVFVIGGFISKPAPTHLDPKSNTGVSQN